MTTLDTLLTTHRQTIQITFTLDYADTTTAPDAAGLVLPVATNGQVIGYLNCIHVGGGVLQWFGKSAHGSASGGTYATREEAAADILDWRVGRHPAYTQHAIVPWPRELVA